MTISAMFPIIPQHLSYPPPPLARPASSRKPPVLVVAAGDIPAHTRTPAIPLNSIIEARLRKDKYEVGLSDSGLIEGLGGHSTSWVRHARVAPDCHSVNVIARLLPAQSAVILTNVRTLQQGEEIKLWFDHETLAAAGIPFLAPNNIQGEKNYICHKCGKRFEYPNPLKTHLSLNCGTLRRIELWKRLTGSEAPSPIEKGFFTVNNFSKPLSSTPPIPTEHSNSPSISNSPNLQRSNEEESARHSSKVESGRFSAFKPYLSLAISESNQQTHSGLTSSSQMTVPSNLIFSSPPFYPSHMTCEIAPSSFHTETDILDQQAVEVETLVSNLGRSKQGHLCIYCGKLYSRKYGLKIHIRTHTGFKPLKCKICLRPFGDPSNLNKHVRLHAEGDTPYKCEECGKVLVRRRDLERHIKSRHLQEDCL